MRILVLVIASDSPAHYVEMQKVWVRRCTAFGGVRRIAGRRAPSVFDWCTAEGGVQRCMTDGHVRCMTDGHVRIAGWRAGAGAPPVLPPVLPSVLPPTVDVWFVKAKPARLWVGDITNDGPLSDTVEFDREAMTIYVKGEETYIPGILNKTIEAIRAIGLDYDFVWRTNLSSVLDFDGLIRYCNSIDDRVSKHRVLYESNKKVLYAGYIGLAPIEAEFDSHIRFASGSGFLLAREAVQYLLDNISLLRYDLIDDVAIGALLEPQFGIVHLDRCWIKTGEENIARMVELYAELPKRELDISPLGNAGAFHKQLGIFHFRCETYQHERTVEFMNKVDQGLRPKAICD